MLETLARLRRLRRVMPAVDAIKYVLSESRGGTFRVHPRELEHHIELRGKTTDPCCFRKIFIDREYQSPFQIDANFIIDAGANTGLSALYFAARYPKAKIVAIEPEPGNFATLSRNCRRFPNVSPTHGALWHVSGEIALTDSFDGEAWGYSVGRDDMKQIGAVKAYTIPEILADNRMDHVDILKLDIEGAEKELFCGNTDWLDRISLIVMELHDRHNIGCARAVYTKLCGRQFRQEVRGENIFIRL